MIYYYYQYTHNIDIQMKLEELTKTVGMIWNWQKQKYFSVVRINIAQ